MEAFSEFILSTLSVARRRRQVTTELIVMFIAPTPRLVNGVLEVAFFVISTQGVLYDGDAVFEAVEENEEELVQAVSRCIIIVQPQCVCSATYVVHKLQSSVFIIKIYNVMLLHFNPDYVQEINRTVLNVFG